MAAVASVTGALAIYIRKLAITLFGSLVPRTRSATPAAGYDGALCGPAQLGRDHNLLLARVAAIVDRKVPVYRYNFLLATCVRCG